MSKRKIWLNNPINPTEIIMEIDWGDYAFLIYYASKIDVSKTLTLIRLLRGESHYEMALELPISDPNPNSEEMIIGYNRTYLDEAINFLNNNIIPALRGESKYMLIDKYRGIEELENLIMKDPEPILDIITVFEEWYSLSLSTQNYIDLLHAIKEAFELLRDHSVAYTVCAKI